MVKDGVIFFNKEEKMLKFLNKLSMAASIYICSYDCYGQLIHDFTGNEKEQELLDKYIPAGLRHEMYQRLALNGLEDQIIENTESPYIKAAAVSLKFDGKCKEVCFLAGIIGDVDEVLPQEIDIFEKRTDMARFIKTIDVLREIGNYKVNAEFSICRCQEVSRKTEFSANEMAESLKRVETLTQVLKYLDSDKNVETIMRDFLKITSEYLGVGAADIYKLKEQPDFTMDTVVSYLAAGKTPLHNRRENLIKLSFLEGKKPIILSSGLAAVNTVREEWKMDDIQALAALPITIGNTTNMYAVYVERDKSRSWKIEDLQFLSDSIRVLQNILEKRIQKNSIASSYASLQQILEHVGCGIIVNDIKRKEVLFQNSQMRSLFSTENMDNELKELFWTDRYEERSLLEYCDTAQNTWYEIHYSNINWVDGRPVYLFAIYDVTDKKNYQRKIEQQAYTDFLTGLLNRMCCERDLACIIDEAKRRNRKGALLYMDLDDFKHINDGLGHQYGDILLKNISDSISSIKGIEESCYRMGGDEFVIIVPPENYKAYNEIISNIKRVFARPWYLKDGDYYCTMSMGSVIFPDDGESVEDLIKKADIAMYQAKKTGKNKLAQYSEGDLVESNKHFDMEKNMREAVSENIEEFLVYYQPIIDISDDTKRCIGAEALVRWNSKVMGFISPGEFIPLAEYLGLINQIGDFVMLSACRQCKTWNDSGYPDLSVSVNLSVVQLMREDTVDIVKGILKETGISPANLVLEVTESLAINDLDRMKEIMYEIRQLGVRIALDDFGTGYSSLNHIREIPLDIIKVDQSFVRKLADDNYSKAFIRMVSELARAIGVKVCVEGAETEEQYRLLKTMGAHKVQGFYFDRPMPGADFEKKYII